MKLLRAADAESISEAIRLLQDTVYSFSMKVCGHPEDAEDTMQEVLMGSLSHLARIEEPRAMAVWLYTVTRNRCWRMRRKGVRGRFQTLSLEDFLPDDDERSRLLKDPGASPEQALLIGEQDGILHRAVLSIPAQYRIVLVLHDMEELETDQVAQILNLQPGTVRVRLHRARLAVRKAMTEMIDTSHDFVPTGPPNTADGKLKKRKVRKESAAPPECLDLFANLSEYLDGRLESRPCREIARHIEACPACVAFLRQLRDAVDRCRSLEISCDADVALRLRTLLTSEYLRMLKLPVA